MSNASKISPRPEYVLKTDTEHAWRIASKYFPNCTNLELCGRTFAENIYEVFMNHLTELREVYETFIDEESRKAFCGYWLGTITRQFAKFHHAAGAHYITEGFIPKPGMIFIDGGAFDGRVAKFFNELGCKVYAFEMDSTNFELSKKYVVPGSNIVLENLGLGAYTTEMRYTPALASSRLQKQGSETAQIVSLDSYVAEKKLPRVDCIKLDVEGSELDVLKGASTTIKRYKPILLLSAYHKWDDIWVLMNFIKSIRSDYEWAFRHYSVSLEGFPDARNYYDSLGLELVYKTIYEACLLAR